MIPASLSRVLAICLLAPACLAQDVRQAHQEQSTTSIEVYFSPKGGCTDAILKELKAAKNTVLVQAYSFTSAPIAKALVDAHKRGVQVEVILDKSQRTEKYSSATFLVNMGVPTLIDAAHAIAHNKIMVVDDATVITGSFNFTKAAEENNAENLLVIRSPELAAKLHGELEGPCRSFRALRGEDQGLFGDRPREQAHSAGQRDGERLYRLKEFGGLPQGGLRIGGEDCGQERHQVCQQG